MHTNTHGYVSKYITYENACVMDGCLEKLLKDCRLNQCSSIIRHQSVVRSYSALSTYLATVVLVIAYTVITIQPSLFSVESDEVFKSFAWANR